MTGASSSTGMTSGRHDVARMIGWTDRRGRLNVFVDDPLTFEVSPPIPIHEFTPYRWANGPVGEVSDTCSWCRQVATHPIHAARHTGEAD